MFWDVIVVIACIAVALAHQYRNRRAAASSCYIPSGDIFVKRRRVVHDVDRYVNALVYLSLETVDRMVMYSDDASTQLLQEILSSTHKEIKLFAGQLAGHTMSSQFSAIRDLTTQKKELMRRLQQAHCADDARQTYQSVTLINKTIRAFAP